MRKLSTNRIVTPTWFGHVTAYDNGLQHEESAAGVKRWFAPLGVKGLFVVITNHDATLRTIVPDKPIYIYYCSDNNGYRATVGECPDLDTLFDHENINAIHTKTIEV